MNELNRQLIAMYAKQLRVPTFNQYEEVVRQLDGGKSFDDFLVSLMRAELENGNYSIFSQRLKSEISKNLKNRQQTILFLNTLKFLS